MHIQHASIHNTQKPSSLVHMAFKIKSSHLLYRQFLNYDTRNSFILMGSMILHKTVVLHLNFPS